MNSVAAERFFQNHNALPTMPEAASRLLRSLAEVEAHAAEPGSRFSLEMHRFSCTHADVSAKIAAAADVASDVDAMLH